MAMSHRRAERPQCPIGLVAFEAEGPNRPFSLSCSHNLSQEQLELFLKRTEHRLECPLCNHPLPSRNFSDYKPNYGMIEVLQQLETASVRTSELTPQAAAPVTSPSQQQPSAAPETQNVYIPGTLAEVLPIVRVGSSNETPAAATSELEALPSAGSEELAHLWPRVVARYWINAPEVLGNRASWEPWGVDADGNLVYSATLSPHRMKVAVLELKLPPFTVLDACPAVQLWLLAQARHTTLPRLRPHSIQFVGIGEYPANETADDSKGLAAGLAVYELPQACLAEHISNLPQQSLGVPSTMILARMTAAALAEAENNALVTAPPGLSSVVVCPHTPGSQLRLPDFRLAPFSRGGHHHGTAIGNWHPPINLSTLQVLCMSREEVEGKPDINMFSSYVWRLAAIVVVASVGLESFATWQVEEVFAKVLAGEHPNVNATPLSNPVKGILKQCLVADPAARPSAEAVQNVLLMCLANDDGDEMGAAAASCADALPASAAQMWYPNPTSPAPRGTVHVTPAHRPTVHVTPAPKDTPTQCCAIM